MSSRNARRFVAKKRKALVCLDLLVAVYTDDNDVIYGVAGYERYTFVANTEALALEMGGKYIRLRNEGGGGEYREIVAFGCEVETAIEALGIAI